MASLNKVMLIGNLTKDPESKFLQSGTQIVNFSVATSSRFKKKGSDEWQENTEFHNVTVFGNTAKYASEKLKKGTTVYIEGSLKTDKWQDDNGVKHYRTKIDARVVSGIKNYVSNTDQPDSNTGGGYQSTPPEGAAPTNSHNAPPQQENVDDLPF